VYGYECVAGYSSPIGRIAGNQVPRLITRMEKNIANKIDFFAGIYYTIKAEYQMSLIL
jgi:hypothetical protein